MHRNVGSSLPAPFPVGLLALLALLGGPGCLPPLGIGPLPLPMGEGGASVRAGLRYHGHPDLQAMQVTVEGSYAVADFFTVDVGGIYLTVHDPGLYPWHAGDPTEFKHSALPFIRPTFHIGPVTISGSASAFFAAGPEAGAMFGWGALNVGYADPEWSAYAGVSGFGFTYLTEHKEPTGSSWQVVVGGQHRWVVAGGLLLGVDLEVGYIDQDYREHGPSDERTRRAWLTTLGIEIGWAYEPEPWTPPPPGPSRTRN